MQNLLDELTETLQNDDRLVIDGKLAKNKIVELALRLDKYLLKLLLTKGKDNCTGIDISWQYDY